MIIWAFMDLENIMRGKGLCVYSWYVWHAHAYTTSWDKGMTYCWEKVRAWGTDMVLSWTFWLALSKRLSISVLSWFLQGSRALNRQYTNSSLTTMILFFWENCWDDEAKCILFCASDFVTSNTALDLSVHHITQLLNRNSKLYKILQVKETKCIVFV